MSIYPIELSGVVCPYRFIPKSQIAIFNARMYVLHCIAMSNRGRGIRPGTTTGTVRLVRRDILPAI